MPKKPDEVFKLLRNHDRRFEIWFHRGKGSHRIIYHPDIDGKKVSYPIPYHRGHDMKKGYLKEIIKRFNLPVDIFG